MSLLIDETRKAFNLDSIQKGDFIRAKYHTWLEARNGLVAAASPEKLTVLYCPASVNVTNYFPVLASEVAEEKWDVQWSADFQEIQETES